MRKIRYILLAAALLAISCKQEQPTIDFSKLPVHYGYMQFSTDVASRSHLAESMRGKDFGVIGFKYSETSNWGTSKSTATPGDWFYNVKVGCNSDGICSYGEPKQWEDNNYAFFAYHPYNGAGITLSGTDKVNTPTLTYEYAWNSNSGTINLCDTNFPVFDLMTAEAIDANGKGSGRVDLEFKHRLFAFEVLVNNYNENVWEYKVNEKGDFILDKDGNKIIKTDADGNNIIAEGGSARQEITNLTLTLEGLTHSKMVIPMSMQEGEADPECKGTAPGKCTFKISDDTLLIPAFNETFEQTFNGETEEVGAGVATSISKYGSKNGGYLFLIPQEGTSTGITGTLDWVELKYFQQDGGEVANTFESTIDFEPGILYQIHINFVGNGITIALIAAGNWDSDGNVTHTFE